MVTYDKTEFHKNLFATSHSPESQPSDQALARTRLSGYALRGLRCCGSLTEQVPGRGQSWCRKLGRLDVQLLMDQFAGDLPWFVVRTRAHKDAIALCELRKQGVFVFCPMIRKTIRRARRLVDRQIPLFPGYIFISFEPEVCFVRAVNSTRGVRSLLVNEAGRPGRVPPAFVRELQAHTREDGLFTFKHSFSRGEKVRVDSGAFAGLLGQIEELGDGGRAKVLLHLMSREVTVNLSADDLRRIT